MIVIIVYMYMYAKAKLKNDLHGIIQFVYKPQKMNVHVHGTD